MSLINVEKTIDLDVYDHDTTPSAIKAIQMDAGTRTVFAVIRNSGQTYDIGQNASVSLIVLRPDKTKVQITGEPYPITETTMDGETITYYGVSAELTQLALAVKGNLKAQFKIASGEQELRTEIFAINNGEALDAGDGDWAGDLDGHNLDEMAQDIEDTKAAVSEMESDVSELKSGLNAENARAEAEEARIEALFTGDVEDAVNAWLDEHPEVTTTVEDGSLTIAKFTESAQAQVVNDYVTPEMYGAVGDGTTDDTQAIQNMFASSAVKFVFGNKIYMVDGAIDVTKKCEIYFNNTEIIAKVSNEIRDFDYVVGFKASDIATFGKLTVSGNNSVDVCVWLAECGRSSFDVIATNNARVWGVYIDRSTDNNNTLSFNKLSASQCGYKVTAKARRVSANQLSLSNIASDKVRFGNIRRSLFTNKYANSYIVIDDSGYNNNIFLHNRSVFMHTTAGITSSPFDLDENDPTIGTFTINTNIIEANYASDVDVNVFIPIGGGISLQSKHSEGVLHIGRLETLSNPMSASIDLGYGGRIDSYASEYDTLVMHCDALAMSIGYMYLEATGNGYQYKFNNAYDKIVSISSNSNGRIYVDNPFVGLNKVPFEQGQGIVYNQQYVSAQNPASCSLFCPSFLAASKLNAINEARNDTAVSRLINENSPRVITIDSKGFNGGTATLRTIRLTLADLNSYHVSGFEPITIYVRKFDASQYYNIFTIVLEPALITAGYSIHGAVDNILTLDTNEFNNFMKIVIILFKKDKTFYVTAEPLTFVDNTTI